jgi:vacuolar-type H+-ATPase subunit F/Vma7
MQGQVMQGLLMDGNRIAVIGEEVRVAGYGLAGAAVLVAADAPTCRAQWASLGTDVAVVILTPAAAAALTHERAADQAPLSVVMPT